MKSQKSIMTLQIDGGDLGEQYLAKMKAAPFNWVHGDDLPPHMQTPPGEAPIAPLAADTGPKPWADWKPATASAEKCGHCGVTVGAGHQYDCPVVTGATLAEAGAALLEGAVTTLEKAWPKSEALADPTEQPPVWQTTAKENDGQDGYRYRAESGEDIMGRVVGTTAGFACRLCNREAKLFAHEPGDTRSRDACCAECLQGIDNILNKMGGEAMEQQNLTQMELAAIKDARVSLYNALLAQGIAKPFDDATAEQMDAVIRGVWEGVRASMQRQSATGQIPF